MHCLDSPNSSMSWRLSKFLVLVLLAQIHCDGFHSIMGISGAQAKPVLGPQYEKYQSPKTQLASRDDSPTNVCKRWSHQTAVINGTMYIYGGRSTTDASQTDNTWNNDFLTLDLTSNWDISSPKLTALPQPSGPPAVANGYLWHSYDSLFLYGGEFSDNPSVTNIPEFSLWTYDIPSSSWKQYTNPITSTGSNSAPGNQPVQRSAEGAGFSIAQLGRGWYFGGHLDGYTTKGWSQSIPRVYLKSMIEYTFPGYTNNEVDSLSGDKTAGEEGVWRNITEGGLQDSAGFTERADGVLVYVPGFGKEGIILGLAGGTNESFTQMNVIDVYDIANSTWYKQATSGSTPKIRVNPCAVAAAAADGSSTQVYLYGGQNLIPYGEQIQYDDMWILTIPSFTWIQVDMKDQSVPPARAGHSCNIWNSQIVVTGGYVGQELSCDSPGIYVFDASQLKWQNQYTALQGGNDLNQQASQKDKMALSGSYGYKVPKEVQSIIGGDDMGKATITAPAMQPTAGPLATGAPKTYTVTGPGGSVTTQTSAPSPGAAGHNGGGGPNVGAIVAGVIAGCLAILAAYLGFCIYVYRRQLALYKKHMAAVQRSSSGSQFDPRNDKTGYVIPARSSENASGGVPSVSDQATTPASAAAQASAEAAYANREYRPSSMGGQGLGKATTADSSTDDLLAGQEPTFLGVMLNPRRSLRVINKD